ncbi:MAG TPA: hypothetical protein VFE60_28375 [Roseiarcus sp.]|nr:hypothetical protein [Roseiarcus sp.]
MTERLAAKGGVAKARAAPEALVEIEAISRPRRPRYTKPFFARSGGKPSVGGHKHARRFQTQNTNRLIRRGRTAGNRA